MSYKIVTLFCVLGTLYTASAEPFPVAPWLKEQPKSILCNQWVWHDPVLGYINTTCDWYMAERPLNPIPEDRIAIDTKFMLHTPENPAVYEDVFISADNLATVEASTFNVYRPTVMIIHGYLDNGGIYWLKDMAALFLANGDYNVLRVDWGKGANSYLSYSSSVSNTRVVGREISHLVNTLKAAYGLDPKMVHLVGHSLGSHVSGYAGSEIENLGRITGLDPAGPYFTGTPEFMRLDETDAIFVDNIHTDTDPIYLLGYGTEQPMGTVDFYPNGGAQQPGCNLLGHIITLIEDGVVEATRDLACCNHIRAIKFFQDSLRDFRHLSVGYQCADYETFKGGNCFSCNEDNSNCSAFGLRATEFNSLGMVNVPMYFDTTEREPFVYQHYVVSILTGNAMNAEEEVHGFLSGTFYGANGNMLADVQFYEGSIYHGDQIVRALITDEIDIDEVLSVTLNWHYDEGFLEICSLLCNKNLYMKSIEVTRLNVYPESARLEKTFLGCGPSKTTEIEHKGEAYFVSQEVCVPVA